MAGCSSWSEDHTLRLWSALASFGRILGGPHGEVKGAVELREGADLLV